MWVEAGKLITTCDELVQKVEQVDGIELNVKRNYVTYLHHILT